MADDQNSHNTSVTQEPFEHLNALRLRFAHESDRWRQERVASVRHWRQSNLDSIGREIDGEIAFLAKLGIVEPIVEDMSDDELLAALASQVAR